MNGMVNFYDVWAGEDPPHNHGGAVTRDEFELIAQLPWKGTLLRTVWLHDRDGYPLALLWPMDISPPDQGNLVTEDGTLMAYSSRDH